MEVWNSEWRTSSNPLFRYSINPFSKYRHHERGEVFKQTATGRAVLPVSQQDFIAGVHIRVDNAFHGVGKFFTVNGEAGFIVQAEAAHVEVGGADQSEFAIHDQRFGVHERRMPLENVHASQQEIFVEGAAGQTGIEVVVFFRYHEADIHAAQRGGAQGSQDIHRRHEIGCDGKDLLFGENDTVEETFNGDIFDGGGSGADETSGDGSGGFGVREIFFGQESGRGLFGNEIPVAQEGILQFLNDGTFGLEVVIADGRFAGAGDVFVVQINSAVESDFPVNDERLAVVAQVDLEPALKQVGLRPSRDFEAGQFAGF